jgi:tetratricopeptide (TPR) repeat protein
VALAVLLGATAASLCGAAEEVQAAADPAALAARIDALQPRRDDPQANGELEQIVSEALRTGAEDYGLLWRAARYKFWLAEAVEGDRKRDLGKEVWDLGERAVRLNAAGVEGHYYTALGIGAYAEGIGVVRALALGAEGKFNAALDEAIRINADFNLGAPHLMKGRYWFELPWFKRDLRKSREQYEVALAAHPENLRGYLYLAETLLKDGEPARAREAVAQVLGGSVDYDPPEGRRVQAEAGALLEEIQRALR